MRAQICHRKVGEWRQFATAKRQFASATQRQFANAPHNCAQISNTVATAQVARCSRRTLQAPLWKPGRPLLLPQHLYAAVCANHGPHRHESDTRPGQPEKRAHGAGSPRRPRREQESPTLAAGRVGAVPRCVGAELPSDYIAELLCSVERTCYSVYGDYAAELHARNCLTARPQTTCDSPRGLGQTPPKTGAAAGTLPQATAQGARELWRLAGTDGPAVLTCVTADSDNARAVRGAQRRAQGVCVCVWVGAVALAHSCYGARVLG